jgi:hypothetical protein
LFAQIVMQVATVILLEKVDPPFKARLLGLSTWHPSEVHPLGIAVGAICEAVPVMAGEKVVGAEGAR